jgi:hypothetical protein
MYFSIHHMLALVVALCLSDCDAFTQQQPRIRNSFDVATDLFRNQLELTQQKNPAVSGTALSMGIVEDFITDTDEKTRKAGNEKYLAELQQRVDRINGLEGSIEDLGDEELQAKTEEFKQRLKNGEDINGPLLEEVFAVVREAAW